jgi:hypothetical protein
MRRMLAANNMIAISKSRLPLSAKNQKLGFDIHISMVTKSPKFFKSNLSANTLIKVIKAHVKTIAM